MQGNSTWIWVLAGCATAAPILFYVFGMAGDAKLRETGEPATARIVAARQTGTWVNHNPQVELEVEVTRAGSAPYPATLKVVVPQLNLAAVQPGQVLRIRVAADRPTRAVVDEAWAR